MQAEEKGSDFIKRDRNLAKTRFIITLKALAGFCVSATAQEMTTDDWFKKGQELGRNGSYTDAIKAYDMAIKMSPKNATIWIEEDDTRKLAHCLGKAGLLLSIIWATIPLILARKKRLRVSTMSL